MIKIIIRVFSFLFLSICLTLSTIFIGVRPTLAFQSSLGEDNRDSISIVSEDTTDSIESSNTSNNPDLGDDQTFPFIPGFGKNSGKD